MNWSNSDIFMAVAVPAAVSAVMLLLMGTGARREGASVPTMSPESVSH